MKKIISALLCLATVLFVLVGCSENEIGKYIENYDPPKQKEKININLHIICEDTTSQIAYTTVKQRIADYTASNFDTTVNVVYSYASAYKDTLDAAIAEGKADIVLINSKSLADELISNNLLADLSSYIEGDKYGKLNAKIASSLLEAYSTEDKMYTLPNNHVIGKYKYVVIDRDVAEFFYKGSAAELAKINTEEAYNEMLGIINTNRAALNAAGITDADTAVSEYISIVDGMYEDKAAWENNGYACNILANPEVSLEDGFYGAFGIMASTKDVERAMEILYAINTDATLHNYLLFGIPQTNYDFTDLDVQDTVVRKNNTAEDHSAYHMNPLYTGDIFASLYCENIDWNKNFAGNNYFDSSNKWTKETAANGVHQNLAAVYNP